jgi:hypothetical protein
MIDPTELLDRLCAQETLSERDRRVLAADWHSGQAAAPDSRESAYWSLRLLRDLSVALFGPEASSRDPGLERELAEYEADLITQSGPAPDWCCEPSVPVDRPSDDPER